MALSVDMDIDPSIQIEKKKKKKFKDLSAVVEHVEDSNDSNKKKKKKKEESGSVKEGDEAALIQLVAKYLEKRNLTKTLSSFLSETQCENSWKTQTIDLEDIFNQYSNQDSEKLKKHDVEITNSHVNQDSNSNLQEQELKTKNADKVVYLKVEPALKRHLSASGSLKPQASRSDGSDSSSDDSEDEVAVSKKKNNKESEKDCYPDSEKLPKQTNSGKQGNLLQKSPEVMKEEKKKRKKNPKDKDLIDSDEQKTNIDQENKYSCKDKSKPSKAKRKQKDSENLGESLQESLEAPKEEKKEKKKKIEDKDGHKTSAIEENKNSIKEDRKSSKTSLKQIDSGKVDESFKKEKKRKKNKNSDKRFINNDEQKTSNGKENGNSIKDNSTLSKASKDSKNVLGLYEPLQESLKVAKDKKKKEEDAEGKDASNNDKENDVEKTKKKKFNKLETSGSNVINEEPTTNNLKDSTVDTDNPLYDTTPLNKKVKVDEGNISVSSNSKQNSIEPTTAKAFQRVKLEEVKFVDPRLKDNSYWAKSGAEVGYGAKAEQVLGQVRGKDFRHEKTKKKRGSYKGGMIDLQSHSIKFNYSDED